MLNRKTGIRRKWHFIPSGKGSPVSAATFAGMNHNQTVAFTGHRKERILQGSGNDSRILAQIREAVTGVVTELYGQGYKEYYTGMASGFDMTAAEAVLQVRERYEDIKLHSGSTFSETALVV